MFRTIDSLADAWYDDKRAVPILLSAFVVSWTLFHTISSAAIGLYPDMIEMFDLSRHPKAGYSNHPPLGALIAGAWFLVFPIVDWSFYLLAMTNTAIALFAIDLIARRYLLGDKRLLVLLLLMFTPFYQFHGVRFGANQTLLSTWPIATYCFIRAFETRAMSWAIAAGIASALAMLGKYFSVFLLVGFAVAAFAHPARWLYLRSGSPWVSAAVGMALLAPHVHWLMNTGYQPFNFVVEYYTGSSFVAGLQANVTYTAGALGYVLLPLLVYWLCIRPGCATWAEAFWPSDPDRRMLVILLIVPLIAPMILAPFIGAELKSLWTMQSWFLLPIALLMPRSSILDRKATKAVAIAIAAVMLVLLVASPAVALIRHLEGTRLGRAYYRGLSDEVTRLWHQTTERKLAIVLVFRPAAFYNSAHPDILPGPRFSDTPWVTLERLNREGWVAACEVWDQNCIGLALGLGGNNPAMRSVQVEVVPRFFGYKAKPRQFFMATVPPKL